MGGKGGLMNSLGMIPVPQMAASSHDNYGAGGTGPASMPLVIDESSTAAADNTMQQILNQSQLTGSACDTSTNLVGFDGGTQGPSSIAGHHQYMPHQPTSTGQLLSRSAKQVASTTGSRPRQNTHFGRSHAQV